MVYSDYILCRLMSCVRDGFIPLLWIQGWDISVGKMSLKCALPLCPPIHSLLPKYCHNTEAVNHSRASLGNNRNTELWRSGWALQGIKSITSLGGKNGVKSLWFNGCFQIRSSGCRGKKGINYMPVKVHTRWNSTFYLISPREYWLLMLFSRKAIDKIQNSAPSKKVLAQAPHECSHMSFQGGSLCARQHGAHFQQFTELSPWR